MSNIEDRKKIFKLYLYGYLNTRMAARIIEENSGENTYERKKKDLVNYLKINRWPSPIITILCFIIKRLELPLSLLIETIRFIYAIVLKIKYIHRPSIDEIPDLYIGIRELRLGIMLKNARINANSITVVSLPFDNNDDIYTNYKTIHLLSLCTITNIWKSYIYSIRLSILMNHKYGSKDLFFRYYSSFEFFLIYFFVTNSHSCRFYYSDNYSRWAFLFGNFQGDTVYLQHGMVGDDINSFIKTGCPKTAYFINEHQKRLICKYLFCSKPVTYYMSGLEFTSNEKLLDNGNLNVLLVCRSFFLESEKKISLILSMIPHINVYIKPHPLDAIDEYIILCDSFGYTLLGRSDFPKVDFVVAYNSTLALEYQDAGVQVHIYKCGEEQKVKDVIFEKIKNK